MQRTGRRRFLLGAGVLAAAPLARAQKPEPVRTLGILSFDRPYTAEEIAASPVGEKLAGLGWVHGRNLRLEPAFAAGRLERLPELGAGLVDRNVDAIWAVSPPAAVAAARATRTIPIVFVRVVWPVELGLARSYARPGGNVTGVASVADPKILAKPSEHLLEAAPGIKLLATLGPKSAAFGTVSGGTFVPALGPQVTTEMARLGVSLRRNLVDTVEEMEAALADTLASHAEGLFVASSPLIFAQRKRIADFALRHRLPSAFIESVFVDAGGLLSYGSSVWGTIFQSLDYVDKVLRGARPAQLPIQLPTQMELVVNLKTAVAIGVSIPQPLLLRADRVIQ